MQLRDFKVVREQSPVVTLGYTKASNLRNLLKGFKCAKSNTYMSGKCINYTLFNTSEYNRPPIRLDFLSDLLNNVIQK